MNEKKHSELRHQFPNPLSLTPRSSPPRTTSNASALFFHNSLDNLPPLLTPHHRAKAGRQKREKANEQGSKVGVRNGRKKCWDIFSLLFLSPPSFEQKNRARTLSSTASLLVVHLLFTLPIATLLISSFFFLGLLSPRVADSKGA